MEKDTGEQTAVLLDPCLRPNVDERSLYPGSHVYQDDVCSVLEHKRDRSPCHHLKRCLSWLIFGLLCLLIGALAGVFLRPYLLPYLDDRDQSMTINRFENGQLTEDLHTLPETPQAFKQNDISSMATHHHQKTGNHSIRHEGHHVSSDQMESEKNAVINTAVRQILENMTGIQGLSASQLNAGFNLTKDPSQRVYLSVGMRNDYSLQACGKSQLKQSFPDVDYALFGYDILRGFPLAVGHDPGFTLPIFRADYSAGGQSADCRYSIPKGLVIVPDVSCVTSFTSEIIKTQDAFSSSLSVTAGVHASGWGASFSLSAGYNKAKSELEGREKVYVLSTASCQYYFSKIVQANAPEFDPNFLQWVKRLESSDDEDTYIEFFNTYGTHFPVETTFGARYTYEHSMTSAEFKSKESQGINVAMAASYSGLFSVGGSVGLNSEEKKQASSFSQKIETKTVTVGAAPPANGDAMTWASTVQLNPVPVNYKLSSIENLFTAEYMGGIGVNYTSIHYALLKYKPKYQGYLNTKALIDRCKNKHERYFALGNTRFWGSKPFILRYGPLSRCIDECFNNNKCEAISFHDTSNKCSFYSGTSLSGVRSTHFKSVLLPKYTTASVELTDTTINGTTFFEQTNTTLSECEDTCQQQDMCSAFSYADMVCKLYKKSAISNAFRRINSHVTYIFKCANIDISLGAFLNDP